MRISDWSSDVCSPDLRQVAGPSAVRGAARRPAAVEAETLEIASGVAGVAGEHGDVDAELADGALPLVVEGVVEHQVLVGGDVQPAVGLDLRVELAGPPAGIAERQQLAARSLAGGDVAEDVDGGGQRADRKRPRLTP